MNKIRTFLFLMLLLLALVSCDLFDPKPAKKDPLINQVVLDDKAILLKNGQNRISFKNPTNKVLCTFAVYTPESYPSETNASYSIQSSFLNSRAMENIGDSDHIDTFLNQVDGMEAELFYISENIRFFYLSGGGFPDIEDSTKNSYETKITRLAGAFEEILDYESNLLFGHDYVDVDGNGYFSVYLVNWNSRPVTAGLVYNYETKVRDIFYVNTSNYDLHVSTYADNPDYDADEIYEDDLVTIFAHELFHYMDEQSRSDNSRNNYFMFEGMATFVASLAEQHLNEIEHDGRNDRVDALGNLMFDGAYLYHPMKSNRQTGYLQSDYYVGCDFWAYIWNVYGADKFKAMIPYCNTVEAIETVLGKDFRTVYREFLLSVLGASGQPVDGYTVFPNAKFYQLEDSWSLLVGLQLSKNEGDPTSFIGSGINNVDTEIAPLGFDVKVWYDNPDILTITADPGVEVYAFTVDGFYLGSIDY